MKKLMMMLVAAMAMMMFGCSKNDCEKAGNVGKDAMETYCKSHKKCDACECILNPNSKDCEPDSDPTDEEDDKCEGAELTLAETCLKDEKKCGDLAVSEIKRACEGRD